MTDIRIRQALVSVSDKAGLVEFARSLSLFGVSILSTGGTAKLLGASGIKVTEVAEYTGYPEMLDGRLKTLHPKIHGGLLARRDRPEHMAAIKEAGTEPIDLVVVNLYPFAQTVARPGCTFDDAVENIDIGGPTMVRAAAKNHAGVAVVTDPADYDAIIAEMEANGGALSAATRLALAKKAFAHTAAYDAPIANYLTGLDADLAPSPLPRALDLQWEKVQQMRYGENPHQLAAFYRDPEPVAGGLARYVQLQGKELSYNNVVDADAAWECVKTFDRAACAIVKHANPCGVAEAADTLDRVPEGLRDRSDLRVRRHHRVQPAARRCDRGRDREAVRRGRDRARSRRRSARRPRGEGERARARRVDGTRHARARSQAGRRRRARPDARCTQRRGRGAASRHEARAHGRGARTISLFAWRVAKFVKSNAIVFCGGGMTLGVGAGQMSRVDSARIAAIKAQNAGLSLAGAVVASDAFFPFRDGVDVVAQAGARR